MIVKICGITRVDDVSACADAGVHWVGFNLWPQSPRFVPRDRACAMAATARALGLDPVALLVEPTAADVDEVWATGAFARLQLYDPQAPVPGSVRWMRAVRVAAGERPRPTPTTADYDLIETKVPQWGGAGAALDWQALRDLAWPRPWLVAGGIRPDNVADLLRTVVPDGIDVASGVEVAPGLKDAAKIRTLMAAVRAAVDA